MKISNIWGVIAGIFTLILIYLLWKNGTTTVNVIKSGSGAAGGLIKDLQGNG